MPALCASVGAGLALVLTAPIARPSPAQPILSYGVEVASDYVSRGTSVHQETFPRNGRKVEPFRFLPVVQPSATLAGPGGLSLGLLGSFAAAERGPEQAARFGGLSKADEIDVTFAWGWENRLGSFSAGLANYANIPASSGVGAYTEVFFAWGLPVARSLAPKLTHFSNIVTAATYTTLSLGGGERLTWAASLGHGTVALAGIDRCCDAAGNRIPNQSTTAAGVQDLTLRLGYGLTGAVTVALNGAWRPNPRLAAPALYDGQGRYVPDSARPAERAAAPPALVWLSLAYAGTVVE
jgi:hypothetical protein